MPIAAPAWRIRARTPPRSGSVSLIVAIRARLVAIACIGGLEGRDGGARATRRAGAP